METLNGILFNRGDLVILNKNAKNKTKEFARICADEFLTHKKIDTSTIENFETCYNNTLETFYNTLENVFDLHKTELNDYNYKYNGGCGVFGYSETAFIIYENGKKLSIENVLRDVSKFKIEFDCVITDTEYKITSPSTYFVGGGITEIINIDKMLDDIKTIQALAKVKNFKVKGVNACKQAIKDNATAYIMDYTRILENFEYNKKQVAEFAKRKFVKSVQEIYSFNDALKSLSTTESIELIEIAYENIKEALSELQRANENTSGNLYLWQN